MDYDWLILSREMVKRKQCASPAMRPGVVEWRRTPLPLWRPWVSSPVLPSHKRQKNYQLCSG